MGKALRDITLDSKYTETKGTVLINGNQALVRLPLIQQALDEKSGLNTAGFISGYRGSPLGGFDAALWQVKDHLEAQNVHFQPGVNEDLAATSVTGSQQLDALPDPQVDGVFSIWYGKGPGVDRSLDAFKHGNFSGAHKNGGVLVVYGDDHPGKSSTVCNQSDPALASIHIPSLYPANVSEFFEFGLLGWALSRYSGSWVGFKCVNETVEQTATCDIDLDAISIETPDRGELPEGGVNYHPIAMDREHDEKLVLNHRLPLVHAFVRANNINRITHGGKGKLGIITAGKAWQDTLSALQLLGIDQQRADELGLSIFKIGCIWPLEPEGLQEFAANHDELLFVEEKKGLMEEQAAHLLYNSTSRPRLSGKLTPEGKTLISLTEMLEARDIATAIVDRLQACGNTDRELADAGQKLCTQQSSCTPSSIRAPYFCSGCPHNTSTKLPEGSMAMSGIGCHGMAGWYRPDTLTPLQMGGEGTNWIGLAPFSGTKHIFQNLGDGTYYHSGLLAIRAACAANVNITYKILYNDAVAMTGGQPVDGPISVGEISHQVIHEGVKRCVVVSDNPSKFNSSSGLASGVEIFHRDQLDKVQRELRDTSGCTVIIYEQTCAAEKRRRRKRGKIEDPAKRMFINPAVCEGCGDCSAQSTCVSIQPLETAFGRKRQIDQSSCNKDYSCNKGFCPSFVTIYDAQPKRPDSISLDERLLSSLPLPAQADCGNGSYGIMIAGIGGTGVITVGAMLGMAAHLEHRACSIYDMTGLSQKNGAVYSHLKIADSIEQMDAQRIGRNDAKLLLGFDLIAAQGGESAATIGANKTHIIGNSRVSNTARFQLDPNDQVDTRLIEQQLSGIVGEDKLHLIDATGLALALCGDTIAGNMFMVGYAFQKGLLPLTLESIQRAIELNGTAVAFNQRAFTLGRLAAHDLASVQAIVEQNTTAPTVTIPESLDELVVHHSEHLTQYQDATYASRYCQLVKRTSEAERKVAKSDKLAQAVARYYAKLLSYKDEYEVARLHADPAFMESLKAQFSGDMRIEFNLAPPILTKRDPETGQIKKRAFGSWMLPAFRFLARFKSLRGTPLDIFSYTEERKMERQLIADYESQIEEILFHLTEDNLDIAIQLAELPESIRGYGHVKEKHVSQTRARWETLRKRFLNPEPAQVVNIQQPEALEAQNS